MQGFHRDRDRRHSGRGEHDERQGRPTRQMRGREIKTRRKKEVSEAKRETVDKEGCGKRVGGGAREREQRVTQRGRGEVIGKVRQESSGGSRWRECGRLPGRWGVTARWLQ